MRDGERRKVLLNVSIILVTHLSRSSVTRIIHSCTVLNSTKVKQGVLVFFFWFSSPSVTTKRRSVNLGGAGEESAELLLVTHTEGGFVEVMVSRRVTVK